MFMNIHVEAGRTILFITLRKNYLYIQKAVKVKVCIVQDTMLFSLEKDGLNHFALN
jgi:hypothetical protein